MKIIFFVFLFCFCQFYAQEQTMSLYFDHASWDLSAKEKNKLTDLLDKENTLFIDSILAYTNELGAESYNQSLAYHRLKSVIQFLNDQKINFDKTKIHGEKYPLGINPIDDDPLWRKVEINYHYNTKQPEIAINEIVEPTKVTDFSKIFNEQSKTGNFIPIQLNIEFHNVSASIMDYSYSEVDRLFIFLAENKEVNVFLRGHVCCAPSEELSISRARTIYYMLIQKGIDENRITYKGYSNTLPLVSPELTEEDMQRNRRVEVVFSKNQ